MGDIPTADQRGWGRPCSGRIVTITPLNMQLPVRAEVATIFHRFILEAEERGFRFNRSRDDWGYACRHIRSDPSLPWSNHAWGLAVDLDALANPMLSRLVTSFPRWISGLAANYLLRWGGDFDGSLKDPMHFEFIGTPADAARITRTLKEDDDMTPAQEAQLGRVEEKLGRALRALTVEGSTGEDQSFQNLYSNVAEIKKALTIQGTATVDEGLEKLYVNAKTAGIDAKAASLKADEALAAIAETDAKADQAIAQNAQTHAKLTEIRELVEKALIDQGGSA